MPSHSWEWVIMCAHYLMELLPDVRHAWNQRVLPVWVKILWFLVRSKSKEAQISCQTDCHYWKPPLGKLLGKLQVAALYSKTDKEQQCPCRSYNLESFQLAGMQIYLHTLRCQIPQTEKDLWLLDEHVWGSQSSHQICLLFWCKFSFQDVSSSCLCDVFRPNQCLYD